MYQAIVDQIITIAIDLFKTTVNEGEHFDWFGEQLNECVKLYRVAVTICEINCDTSLPNAAYGLEAALEERYQRPISKITF